MVGPCRGAPSFFAYFAKRVGDEYRGCDRGMRVTSGVCKKSKAGDNRGIAPFVFDRVEHPAIAEDMRREWLDRENYEFRPVSLVPSVVLQSSRCLPPRYPPLRICIRGQKLLRPPASQA